ncbi:unnamed protein product [Moneuplotes crassus]|uniref:Uncharacterized protein n=1 Tax=Euplotes crassus TaxID=5936 RepID=A0AAD1Y4N2_EUPCR|nr:unnamed protein product [Moneuplotes crassus]
MNRLIAIVFVLVLTSTALGMREPPVRKLTKGNAIEPIDFHAPFKYSSCSNAIFDLLNQFALLYGDIYATDGLNTEFYRPFQVVTVKFKAFADACF